MNAPTPVEALTLQDPRAPFIRRWLAGSIDIVLAILGAASAVVFYIAYFWLPEAIWGATLGKSIARVRVVDALGNVPGARRALIRTLTRLLEVNPFLLGGIPAALIAYRSKRGQRLGDMLARTFVLRVSDLPRPATPVES
ncbi:MAG: RDD family protein [Acidobacteriota bacterium]